MANEVRLIDANAMAKEFECLANSGLIWEEMCAFKEAAEMVRKQPTIDPESLRPKGRWEKYWCELDLTGHMYEVCPNCRSCEILDTDKFWDSNYCPNCGAKMEG